MSRFIQQGAAALIIAVASLSGCAPVTPHWESNFGNSVRASLAAQVIDPAAVRNTNPVHGIDSQAASGIANNYAKSFSAPSATSTPMTTGK